MKNEVITALMKIVAITRPAADRALIKNVVAVASEKTAQNNAAAVNEALTRFTEAKTAHTGSMMTLNDIGAAITCSEKERQTALTVCAQAAWSEAMNTISPALVRAYCLRLCELELKGEPRPGRVLGEELQQHVALQAQFYTFDMDNEPVISQLGLHRPPLTSVDMTLYKSPARRMQLAAALAEKNKAQG